MKSQSGLGLAISELTEPLSRLGFRKRAGGVFTAELDHNMLGWLGLNHAARHRPPGTAEINPVVGVRSQAVEQLLAKLRGIDFHAYLPPTISTPLGYLMQEERYVAWIFGDRTEGSTTRSLVSAVEEFGLPFMRSHCSLSELSAAMKAGLGHGLEYRRPVALLLLDDLSGAGQAVEAFRASLGDRKDQAATEYRRFADAFAEVGSRGARMGEFSAD